MIKKQKFHYSVTEAGSLEVRSVIEYQDDAGKVLSRRLYNSPPAQSGLEDTLSKDMADAIVNTAVKKNEPTGSGLEEIITYDQTVSEFGVVSVRKITRIFDEGVEVSKTYHRHCISPGDKISEDEDPISKAIAKKVNTLERRQKMQAKLLEGAIV